MDFLARGKVERHDGWRKAEDRLGAPGLVLQSLRLLGVTLVKSAQDSNRFSFLELFPGGGRPKTRIR